MIGDEYVQAIANYIGPTVRDYAVETISNYLKARGQVPSPSNIKKAQMATNGGYPKRRRYGRAAFGARSARTSISPRNLGFTRIGGYYRGNQVLQGELKFHDVDLDDAVIAAAGTVVPTINIIPQNNTESGRVGRKSVIKAINWRYNVGLPETTLAAGPNDPDIVRVVLYVDKQCNGATSAVTDILETANFLSFNNLANKMRYNILMDRVHVLNYHTLAAAGAVNTMADGKTVQYYTFYKKCNITIEFDNSDPNGILTSQRSNTIGVLLISKAGIATLFQSKFRLRFTDS